MTKNANKHQVYRRQSKTSKKVVKNTQKRTTRRDRQLAYKLQQRYDKNRGGRTPKEIPDNEFIIEQILCSTYDKQKNQEKFLIAWYGYTQTTWETTDTIPTETIEDYKNEGEITLEDYGIYMNETEQTEQE